MRKLNLCTIGLLQSLGIAAYCALLSGLLWVMEKYLPKPDQLLAIALILLLLVLSAAITGSLFFGYAAYLALRQEIKKALLLVVYTMLYSLGIIIIAFVVLAILK